MAKGNKTEKATPRQRKKAREEGNIARSQYLQNSFSIIALVVFLFGLSNWFGGSISTSYGALLNDINGDTDPGRYMLNMLILAAEITIPILFIVVLFSIVNHVLQVRFFFSTKIIKPKPSRINPKSYFQNLFSRKSAIKVLVSLITVFVLGYIGYVAVSNNVANLIAMIGQGWGLTLMGIVDIAKSVIQTLLIAAIVIGIVDFVYQRWEYEQGIMMKKEDVKQEAKDENGDPQMKSKQRSVMTAILQGTIANKMEDASFVINNPTHISVVLRYKKNQDAAPIVVAKGEDEMAMYIRKLAREMDIPMVENRPLARSLYYQSEEEQPISEEFYAAVIEIMRYLIETKKLEA